MQDRHCPRVLSVGMIAFLLLTACGKDRKTLNEGDEAGASSETIEVDGVKVDPITPANHVPPETYRVEGYELGGLATTPPLEQDIFLQNNNSEGSLAGVRHGHEPFYLADDSAVERFYVSHPITLTTSVNVQGGAAAMMVTMGLMERPSTNASEAEIANLYSCTLGSIEVRHSGDTEATLQAFTGQFRIPKACLKPGTTSTQYHIWVAADVEGAVKVGDAEKSKPKIVVYDEAYLKANNICLQLKKDGPCVYSVEVDESPGVNSNLKEMNSTSSVATFDPNYKEGEGSVIPLLMVNSEAFIEGLGEDDTTIKDYQLRIRYEICASRTASPKGDDPNCTKTSAEWSPLQVQDPAAADGKLSMIDEQTVGSLRASQPIAFSATLFARGTTFTRLGDANDWGKERSFLVRECVTPYTTSGVAVVQKNITFQAANADATLDDCRLVSVVMADVRPVPAPTSTPVCTDASGNPTSLRTTALVTDCIPASDVNNLTNLTDDNGFDLAAAPEKTFDLGWGTDLWWGRAGIVQLHQPAYLVATAGSKGAVYQGYHGAFLHGIWGKPIQIVHQGVNGTSPYQGNGYQWSHVDMFGIQLYGRWEPLKETYTWQWVGNELSKPPKNKGVKKAKKYNSAKRTVEAAGGSALGPAAIAVKEYCKSVTAQMSIVRVGLEACAEAGVFLDVGVKMRNTLTPTDAEKVDMPGVSKFGSVDAWFIPALAANVKGAVYFDALIVRAGVEGIITLIQVAYPVTGYLRWGTVANDTKLQVKANAGVDWDLSWLSGEISVFGDILSLSWCRAWFVSYPCGFSWKRLATWTFAEFKGGNVSYTLHRRDLSNTIIDL